MNTIKDMCMTNKGYEEVNTLIRNVVGFVDWLVDVEPVEPYNNEEHGHLGGMNFTILWTNGDKTRFCVRYNYQGNYDVQLNNLSGYRSVLLQVEKDMPREALLSVLITMYSEINEQTLEFLEQHEFKLSRETKKIMKELNDPYGYN